MLTSYDSQKHIVGYPLSTRVIFESRQPEDLVSLRACVRFRDNAKGAVCLDWRGQLAFRFFQEGKQLALLGFHCSTLVWFTWDRGFGIGPLLESLGILDWLTERGIPGPAQEYVEAQRTRALYEQQRQRWFTAMPTFLAPLEQQMRFMALQGRSMDTAFLQRTMEEAHPNPQERARLLFRWYGHGSGSWKPIPSYEVEPENLLRHLPVEVLIQAIDGVELSTEEMKGATRYFCRRAFWKSFGPAWERLPERLLQRLLEHVLQTENRDTAARRLVPRT